MSAVLLAGCVMVAFGVPATVFSIVILRKAQLVIICIIASFFWLVSFLVASLLWWMITPMQSEHWAVVLLGVVAQEISRFIFFQNYVKHENTFSVIGTNSVSYPLIDFYSALAAGVGFGGAYVVMVYGSILAFSSGPGTLFANSCPNFSTFVVSSWLSLAFSVLHMFLMIIAFDAYRRRSVPRTLGVICPHITASLLTLLNERSGGCVLSIPLIYLVVAAVGIYLFWVIRQTDYRSKRKN